MNYKERQEIIAKSPISFRYLKKFNIGAGILQLINGIVILSLTFLLKWPDGTSIYTFYLNSRMLVQQIPHLRQYQILKFYLQLVIWVDSSRFSVDLSS